jgi:hypothetical protein
LHALQENKTKQLCLYIQRMHKNKFGSIVYKNKTWKQYKCPSTEQKMKKKFILNIS